jgi:hypothetical protein
MRDRRAGKARPQPHTAPRIGGLRPFATQVWLPSWKTKENWLASEVHAAVFRALHQYLGVGVGEHLGYLFTGIWSVLIGVGVIQGTALPTWLGWPGIVIGVGLVLGSAEFLGPNEERGWSLAGAAIPFLYIAWSLWLLAMGIALIA